ncbi:alpha/beta fold hydrolase [Acidicapsa dinghuensis]|uniref:Alpha/beta fold hydrolase n=1 Tax=Acidicapsa dinghuensis TaxID=2218256 RepID=A0ABW1E8M6_9BACT|nr:alpha/beta hydrolase [Acidicapsa dinghuensis]
MHTIDAIRTPFRFVLFFALTAIAPSMFAQRIDGKFDVDGRHIRLACQGSGEPTVVIDAGMGTAPVEDRAWQQIAAKVAAVTRVCLYDRAGLGGSDPNPKPVITSADSAADMARVLEVAGLQGPFLVAGHSIGGLHAQVFAARYPAKVAGLVLVSTTHPDQFNRWLSLLPPAADGEAKALTDVRTFLTTIQTDPHMNPERLDVGASEAQARELHSLGAKPVIVLTHSPKFRMVPGLAEPLAIKLEDATQEMQKEYLRLSTNSTQHIAATAGHELPHEDPEFVVEGIVEGVRDVRAGRR